MILYIFIVFIFFSPILKFFALQNLKIIFTIRNIKNPEMNSTAAIAKEVVFSFLREKSFEEGLGFLEYYEVFVDHKQEDPPSVTISIKGIIPGRGLVSPLIEYANRIGKDNFTDELTKYISENIFSFFIR